MTTHAAKYARLLMVCLALVLLGAGCKKTDRELVEQKALDRHERETAQKNAFYQELRGPHAGRTMKGLRFLESLEDHHHLPGISRHGEVGLSSIKTALTPEGSWFFTEEAHIYILSKPPLYLAYEVGQSYSNADFQLMRAWSTDAEGKVIETFAVIPAPVAGNPRQFVWGPANPGAEHNFDHWYNGAVGAGAVAIDNDPAGGFQNFKIGVDETVTGGTNHADLRSEMFSLAGYSKTSGPLTFSFKYKLPGTVKPGDDLDVALRFFGPDDENFLGQESFRVGSSSGDSAMSQYKTMTVSNIFPTPGAVKVDVWVVANIFRPWTSGSAQFDDFSVTTTLPRHWGLILKKVGLSFGLGIVAAIGVLWLRSARRARL
jgi:hypothetical protein